MWFHLRWSFDNWTDERRTPKWLIRLISGLSVPRLGPSKHSGIFELGRASSRHRRLGATPTRFHLRIWLVYYVCDIVRNPSHLTNYSITTTNHSHDSPKIVCRIDTSTDSNDLSFPLLKVNLETLRLPAISPSLPNLLIVSTTLIHLQFRSHTNIMCCIHCSFRQMISSNLVPYDHCIVAAMWFTQVISVTSMISGILQVAGPLFRYHPFTEDADGYFTYGSVRIMCASHVSPLPYLEACIWVTCGSFTL